MPKVNKKTIEEYIKEIPFNGETEELSKKISSTVIKFIKNNSNEDATQKLSFAQLLWTIKDRLTSLDQRGDLNLGNDKHSKYIKEFMYDPIKAYRTKTVKMAKVYEECYGRNAILDEQLKYMGTIAISISDALDNAEPEYKQHIKEFGDPWKKGRDLEATWFNNFFNNGKDKVTLALKDNKGGYFESLFGTTSNEYKEFSRRLTTVAKKGPDGGDLAGLRKSAFAYLKHKLPKAFSTNGNKHAIDVEKIKNLDKTSKGRVRLCLNVLHAIDKSEEAIIERKNPKEFVSENNNIIEDDIMLEANYIGEKQNSIDNHIYENNLIDDELNKTYVKAKGLIDFQNQINNDIEPNINKNDIEINTNTNVIENELNNG